MSIFKKPKVPPKVWTEKVDKKTGVVTKTMLPNKTSPSSGVDTGLQNLRGGLQAAAAAKEKSVLPTSKFGLTLLTISHLGPA